MQANIPVFDSRTKVPKHLKTELELQKSFLTPAADQPVEAYLVHGKLQIELYDPARAQSHKYCWGLEDIHRCKICGLEFADTEGIMDHAMSSRQHGGQPDYHWLKLKRQAVAYINDPNYLFIDTEKSGLGSDDEIIEIALLSAGGDVLFDSLIKPSVEVTEQARNIHGISDEELADAPTWAEVYVQIAQLLYSRYAISHNARFDTRMLVQTCHKYRLPAPFPKKWLCTMEMLKRFNNQQWPSLPLAMTLSGASSPSILGKPHRAAFDAECCRQVVLALAKSENPSKMII
jgi:DNA polymerase III subunit epsilon